MARIRTIKPEFFQDEQLAECSPHARLLAIALLQLCDANGVFRNIPMQVHAHAFPWEAEVNTPALLGELEGVGYVNFYRVNGRQYGCVPGFRTHQRLQGKEAQSGGQYPTPDQADTDGNMLGSDGEYPGASRGDTGTGNREQGTGKEESPTGDSCTELQDSSAPSDSRSDEQDETPVVTHLLTNDKRKWPVTERYIAIQQERFPAVDVMQAIRNMEAWLEANPRKRKTWAGMKAFVTNWLSRDQNRGGSKTPAASQEQKTYRSLREVS